MLTFERVTLKANFIPKQGQKVYLVLRMLRFSEEMQSKISTRIKSFLFCVILLQKLKKKILKSKKHNFTISEVALIFFNVLKITVNHILFNVIL